MGATPRIPMTHPVEWFRKIEADIRLLREQMGNILAGTGLSVPSQGTTQVDGSLVVQNGVARSGNYAAGSAGWNLDHAGNAEFNNLTLRSNIIGNDALTNPVVPQVVNQVATNFAVNGSPWVTAVSSNVTVPANCTQLLCLATGMVFVLDNNTSGGSNGSGGDIIQCRVGVGGNYGMTAGVAITGSNGQTSCSAAVAVLLTGLTAGSTITLVTQATTAFQPFAANANNQANLCATLSWLR